jgi:hypothetical protein
MNGQGVSLKPADAQAGGGVLEALNDTDATIKACRVVLWNYNNTQISAAPFLAVTYQFEDGSEFEQKYKGGDAKFLVPSQDGKEFVPVDSNADRTGLPDGCNALIWLTDIVNAGFPEHLIGRDVSVFEGTRVHLNVKPQPKRPGLKEGNDKAKDILVVTKILALPGQAQAGTAGKVTKGKAGAKAAPATASQGVAAPVGQASADAVQARAIEVVMEILTSNGGSVPKVAIANKAFKIMQDAKDPLRNDVSKLVFKDEFLSGGLVDVPFSFDGTTVSLGE